jgi:hypothetical protein
MRLVLRVSLITKTKIGTFNLKQKYWWNGMKGEITDFVAKCDTCRRIKAEHNDQWDYSNHYTYQYGNRMKSAWIS